MKFILTLHAKRAIENREISIKWIEKTLDSPYRTGQGKKDDNLKYYIRAIKENNNRILRIVVNYKAGPIEIVTAYFDRTLKVKAMRGRQ